jgi:hypothetical protein
MIIAYIKPLEAAFIRMKNALFHPFHLKNWFIIGFTAFLAGLMDGPHGNGPMQFSRGNDFNFEDLLSFPERAMEWIIENPGWFIFFIILGVIVFAILIALLYLSSRGIFMFLDNVVHAKAEVVKPWRQFLKQGNSLFLWRLSFGIICFMIFISFIVLFFSIYKESFLEEFPLIYIVGMVFILLLLVVTALYISLFVEHFVVPIMYKNDLTTLQAWSRFLPLLSRYFIQFIIYGLLLFLLTVIVIIGVVLIGIFTCCFGFLLLIIPYISSVFTLPISYAFRAYSLEFLAQFGEEYNLFLKAEKKKDIEV